MVGLIFHKMPRACQLSLVPVKPHREASDPPDKVRFEPCVGPVDDQPVGILWEEILDRFEKIEVLAEPERTFSSFVKGYTYLPVKLKRKA